MSFELRGWHVLTALLTFFGVIIAVNVAFTVMALRSFPGEDAQRSYVLGVNYNRTLALRRAQAAQGWRASAALEQGAHGAQLVLILRDAHDEAINGAELNGVLQWPTDARRDRVLVFTPAGYGRYVAELGDLTSGRWRMRARVNAQAGALDVEAQLTWP